MLHPRPFDVRMIFACKMDKKLYRQRPSRKFISIIFNLQTQLLFTEFTEVINTMIKKNCLQLKTSKYIIRRSQTLIFSSENLYFFK